MKSLNFKQSALIDAHYSVPFSFIFQTYWAHTPPITCTRKYSIYKSSCIKLQSHKLLFLCLILSMKLSCSGQANAREMRLRLKEESSTFYAKSTLASKINVTPKGVKLSEKLQLTAVLLMKFDNSNKFDL